MPPDSLKITGSVWLLKNLVAGRHHVGCEEKLQEHMLILKLITQLDVRP